jgi:hypothetical protein
MSHYASGKKLIVGSRVRQEVPRDGDREQRGKGIWREGD